MKIGQISERIRIVAGWVIMFAAGMYWGVLGIVVGGIAMLAISPRGYYGD